MKNYGSLLLVWIAISSTVARKEVDDPTLVTLTEGQIRGQALLSPDENVYYAFQDVPYAAPPVGELRFKEPVAAKEWEGELNTTNNTKMCYQAEVLFDIPDLIQTEDCLYLNVYTPLKPGNSSESPLPVLFFIHGGAFNVLSGASLFFRPQYLIDHNLVVVTINYRLGPLGFLTTGDGIIPGNLGLKDQHFAMKWVKKNIALFGGDPEKITISGESAGGMSVGMHLLSPKNKGLFRSGILQSGAALCQTTHQDFARYYAFELGRSLDKNFSSDDSTELLELLLSVPATAINNNTVTTGVGKETGLLEAEGLIWLPVVEDPSLEGAFLTNPYHEDLRTGNINQVPILIGFNSEEQMYFFKADPSLPEVRAKYLDGDLSNLIRNKYNMTNENKLTAGARLKQIYTNTTFEDNPGTALKFFSDEQFTTPIIRHAKLQSNYTDVYLYQFSYQGKLGGSKGVEIAGVQGVGHSEELAYIWDSRTSFDTTPDDPEDLVTRQRLLTLWANFVKYSNPTPNKDSLLDNVIWNKMSPNNLVYLDIDSTLKMKTNPKEYLKWERIIDVYAIPPFISY